MSVSVKVVASTYRRVGRGRRRWPWSAAIGVATSHRGIEPVGSGVQEGRVRATSATSPRADSIVQWMMFERRRCAQCAPAGRTSSSAFFERGLHLTRSVCALTAASGRGVTDTSASCEIDVSLCRAWHVFF